MTRNSTDHRSPSHDQLADRLAGDPTLRGFIRSTLFSSTTGDERPYLKHRVVGSRDGITILFTGEQLNQDDLALWVQITKLHRRDELCFFTSAGMLKALGTQHENVPTGQIGSIDEADDQLYSSIKRLVACAIEIVVDPVNADAKRSSYVGSPVHNVESAPALDGKFRPCTSYSLQLDRVLLDATNPTARPPLKIVGAE